MNTSITSNATVGTNLPSLFSGASSNYKIDLNATSLLALFNTANLSCTSENALVTLNGLSGRSFKEPVMLRPHINDKTTFKHPIMRRPHINDKATAVILPRTTPKAMAARQDAATMNGIVFAMSTPTPTVVAAPSTTAEIATSTASTSSSSSATISRDPDTLNFVRTAVLYIFQNSTSLDTALTALARLQTVLRPSSTATNPTVDAGSGWTVDLSAKTVTKL